MADWMIVVPWVHDEEVEAFLNAWGATGDEPWLLLQQDVDRVGCGANKNAGVERAVKMGAEVVVILDGDCYPVTPASTLPGVAEAHLAALAPQPVEMFEVVTAPPSRGTPYFERSIEMPVAASMGFWAGHGDHCAVRQLATANATMTFEPQTIHGRYFPLCGMNLAFRTADWFPWCRFIDVPRYDDIWMGWLWQREAYRRGYCFNLDGPVVRHARQSNVWRNLEAEARYLKRNETLWREIAAHDGGNYDELRALLPVSEEGR